MSDILLKVEEVAKAVGIASSTVRKYSFLIEKHGYEFSRNNQNALMFDQDEVNMFKELVKIKKQKNMTLENAVQQLLSSMPEIAATSDIATTDIANTSDIRAMSKGIADVFSNMSAMAENMSDMSEKIHTLVDQNNSVINQNKELQKQIEASEKKQIEDHDKLLMQSIRAEQQMKKMELQMEELQKQIATAHQKKKWWQFWKA